MVTCGIPVLAQHYIDCLCHFNTDFNCAQAKELIAIVFINAFKQGYICLTDYILRKEKVKPVIPVLMKYAEKYQDNALRKYLRESDLVETPTVST